MAAKLLLSHGKRIDVSEKADSFVYFLLRNVECKEMRLGSTPCGIDNNAHTCYLRVGKRELHQS